MPYLPSKPPPTTSDDGTALAFYLEDELSRLAMSLLDDVQAVEVRPAHVAPLRPREGMVVYADGTDWNPGSGEGLYTFGSDAAWHFVTNLPVPLSVANGGTGDTGSAWTAFTPGITATVGALTTTSTTGRYKKLGRTVFIEMELTITTNGTGASSLTTTLPFASASSEIIVGREIAINGKALTGTVGAASTSMNICFYDNGYAGANGSVLALSGVYEATS